MRDQKKKLGLDEWNWIIANLKMGHEDEILGIRYEAWWWDLEGGCVGGEGMKESCNQLEIWELTRI